MVCRLRDLIQECLPHAEEKPYYGVGVPFYKRHRLICFIWPSSVHWGPKGGKTASTSNTVSLGFCQGNRMANEDGSLQAEGRKQVYVTYFKSVSEINERKVRAWLYEAGMIDDSFKARKARGKA